MDVADKPLCPVCGKRSWVKKNGSFRGKQRFLCQKCDKSFLSDNDYTSHWNKTVIDQKDEDSIIAEWVNGSRNFKHTAAKYGITLYQFKKIIIKKHKPRLEEIEKKYKQELEKNEITKVFLQHQKTPLYNYE